MAMFHKRRGSTLAAWALGAGLIPLLLLLLDAGRLAEGRTADREPGRTLAARAGLTDPALFNEARYARHLSQADRHAAFQDHPAGLEHFPAGSLAPPPDPRHERLD
jgi:hypothetical protein